MHNWKLTAAILGVLAIPFALAVKQDAGKDQSPREAIAALAADELGALAEPPEPTLTEAELAALQTSTEPPIDERLYQLSGDLDRDLEGGELCTESAREVGDYQAVLDALTGAWGAPRSTPVGSKAWLAPEHDLRAVLDGHAGAAAMLHCEPYLSLDEILGDRGGRLGFERLELVGASAKDVRAAYGDAVVHHDDATMLVYLPPVDLAVGLTPLRLELEAGRVKSFALSLEERRADLALQLIERHAGPARRDGDAFVFDGGRLRLEIDPAGMLSLSGR